MGSKKSLEVIMHHSNCPVVSVLSMMMVKKDTQILTDLISDHSSKLLIANWGNRAMTAYTGPLNPARMWSFNSLKQDFPPFSVLSQFKLFSSIEDSPIIIIFLKFREKTTQFSQLHKNMYINSG
jgi:hypothetical protein